MGVLVLAMASLLMLQTGTALAKYSLYDTDALTFKTGDGKAKMFGTMKWYDSGGDFVPIRRGDYSSTAKLRALQPVGCIWARVHYKYLTGSITVGTGAGGTLQDAEYTQDGWYRSCRKAGAKRPKALSLYGAGYAKRTLRSSTVDLCTSNSKSDGPRFCSYEKSSFGGK